LKRPIALLALGAAAGLALAAAGLLATDRETGALPDDAVAAVNGTPVRRADYERAVEALASDRRGRVDDAERRHVLDRLVDEELLVQRAFELGLARHDRRVRADLVAAVIESVTSEAEQHEPSESELAAFFEANRDYFARPGRQQVEQVFVRGTDPDALARAREAAARLRDGASAADVQESVGDAPVAVVPAAPLPATKLREYLGPAAVDALDALAPGQVSEPLPAAGGQQVLRLVAREPGSVPAFETVAAEVRAERVRRAGDDALRRYIEDLRARAAIRVAGDAP
jgi:hypothetical protein